MSTKPPTYLNWTDGSPSKVTQPPPAQMLSGWTEGEPIPFQYLNWLFWVTDEWIQWLDNQLNLDISDLEVGTYTRLINGGNWSWNLTTSTLAWSAAFQLAIPSIPDANNNVAAGSIALNDGQVAYINANVPFSASGNTTSGSNQLILNEYNQGVVVGQTVTGAGIPANTTVSAIAADAVTLSNNATATGANVVFTFSGLGALTVQAANSATFMPAPNTVILARRVSNIVFVGVNQSQIVLRNLELKRLNEDGYINTFPVIAGQTLTFGQAVYISQSTDTGGRTLGSAYPVDTSVTNGAVRYGIIGFVFIGAATGGTAYIVSSGNIVLSSLYTLVPGAVYYVDPANPGALTTAKPAISNQWIAPAGQAVSTSLLEINASLASAAAIVTTPGGIGIGSAGTTNVNNSLSPYTISPTQSGTVFLVDSSAGAVQMNFPNPSGNANFKFTVKDTTGNFDTKPLTMHRFGTETVEGLAADYVCAAAFGEWSFITDGVNWILMAR